MTTRRTLLGLAGAAALGALLPRRAPAMRLDALLRGLGHDPLNGVGVQLYTLRAAMRENPEATLARIAELGYTEIEWWGQFQRTPAQLRTLLDGHGLSSPAVHVDMNALQPDRLNATLDAAQAMGQRWLIVAWTPPAERTADGVRRLGALLSVAGATAARVGIRTGYHNHDFEFAPHENGTMLDLLLASTNAQVVDLELDCYWALKAGQDPIAYLERYSDRITHLHLKDSKGAPEHVQADVGDGVIDWRRLLQVGTAARVRHVFVEHDSPADAWATVAAGRQYLRSIGY